MGALPLCSPGDLRRLRLQLLRQDFPHELWDLEARRTAPKVAVIGRVGLSVATNIDTAELLNDRIAELARDLVSDDHEVDTDTEDDGPIYAVEVVEVRHFRCRYHVTPEIGEGAEEDELRAEALNLAVAGDTIEERDLQLVGVVARHEDPASVEKIGGPASEAEADDLSAGPRPDGY